jgi:tricorn protease
VYTIPVGGGAPTRLTTHPAADIVRGFTPDGKRILFSSQRSVYTNRYSELFTVPLTGGMPDKLPIPWGFEAAYSPDGEHIAYTPVRDVSAQWKNYRGGTHSRIWIYNVKTHWTSTRTASGSSLNKRAGCTRSHPARRNPRG